MRMIHCSDLHLDSAMETNLSPRQARERGEEILATFANLTAWAAANQVEAVLIAGDLFDSRRVSQRTADFVLDRISRTPEVDYLYLRGNHDESGAVFFGRTMPENLKTFGENWTTYRYGNAAVTAMEPENWESFYDCLTLSPDDTNILLLHGQEATQPGEELIAIPKLRGKHIDYLALGHIHSYRQERLDDRGVWCYCGCLEGRGFDECGPKGFVLLDIDNGRVETAFVPFAARTLHEVVVDISELTTVSQLQQAMEEASADIRADSLVKFTLTGTYTPETQKDIPFLTRLLGQRFYFVKIKDESVFRIEKETYIHDASLKGEFIRLVMASDKTEEEKADIICCGLRALAGQEVEQ